MFGSITDSLNAGFSYSLNSFAGIKIDSIGNIARKASLVALPVMALVAASNVQAVEGFTSCVFCAICLAGPNPACLIPCTICLVTIPAPVF